MQHSIIQTEEPFGLPLNLKILPQALKKAGKAKIPFSFMLS